MNIIGFECYCVTILHIIGLFLPIFGSSILDSGHYNQFISQCGLICPLGYETDIEGNPMCKCNDPCMNIYCFGGTKCVIEKASSNCNGDRCKLEAVCKEIKDKKKVEKSQDYRLSRENEAFLQYLQQDSVTKVDEQHAVCFQEIPTDAFRCRKKRRRYFYDSISGLCVKFRGCESKGNNFAKKKDCKRLCRKERKNKGISNLAVVSEIRADPTTEIKRRNPGSCSASLAEIKLNCPTKLVKRYYFNAHKGRCVRIKGCPSSDKLFRKRKDCKRRCLRKNNRGRKRTRNRKSRSKRRNQNGGLTGS